MLRDKHALIKRNNLCKLLLIIVIPSYAQVGYIHKYLLCDWWYHVLEFTYTLIAKTKKKQKSLLRYNVLNARNKYVVTIVLQEYPILMF